MKSAEEYIVDNLNAGNIEKILQLIDRIDVFELTMLLDQTIVGITMASNCGNGNLLNRLMFEAEAAPVVELIFRKMQPFRFFNAAVRYALVSLENELHLRSEFAFREKLDRSGGVQGAIELGLSIAFKSNMGIVMNLMKDQDRKPIIHYFQKMLCMYYDHHHGAISDSYFELYLSAMDLIVKELGSGIQMNTIFHRDNRMKSSYAAHILNQLNREHTDKFSGLANKLEFIMTTINKDEFEKFVNKQLEGESMLASVQSAINQINSKPSFSFQLAV